MLDSDASPLGHDGLIVQMFQEQELEFGHEATHVSTQGYSISGA